MPKATALVKDRALKLAPLGPTGNLRAGIEERIEQGGLRGAVASTARHSYIVHEGTKPHPVTLQHKRALKIPAGGGVVLRAHAQHPGNRGQPFLTDAVSQSERELSALFRSDGESWLRKVLGR
jgi:hypothetical protein